MFRLLVQPKSKKGFTLIEVMVSLSIFTFVSTAAVGVLLTLINANSKSQNIQTAMFDLSYALDSMTRDIRTGEYYYCGSNNTSLSTEKTTGDCPGSGAFAFDEVGGSLTGSHPNCTGSERRIAFRLNSTDDSIERRICSSNNSDWERLTSPEVEVTDLEFILSGSDDAFNNSDYDAPLLTIYVAGQVQGKQGSATDFSLQTTVTQMALDL